jgi:hypothetical protein
VCVSAFIFMHTLCAEGDEVKCVTCDVTPQESNLDRGFTIFLLKSSLCIAHLNSVFCPRHQSYSGVLC